MSVLAFSLRFEFVIDTATRQKRIRCTVFAPSENADPSGLPADALLREAEEFTGLGTTMEEAILNALAAYRNTRG